MPWMFINQLEMSLAIPNIEDESRSVVTQKNKLPYWAQVGSE